MIKPLRKKHLQIWTAWAILIPIGIITAYVNVPKKITAELIQPVKEKVLPVVTGSVDKKNYSAALRSSEDKMQWQIEWINKEATSHPSALLYKSSNETFSLQNAELLGRVDVPGSSSFPVKKDTTGNYRFILYDIIHKQIIDSLIFKLSQL